MPSPSRQDPSALTFKVLAEIADGETATVELCRVSSGPSENRLVAVKRLHPHLAADPAFVDQFRDEMWLTAALRHPNVVEVVGWGSDDRGLYLAVELVQGVSLARLMKTIFDTGEAFTERMVVFILRQICRGLVKAHALKSPSGEPLNLVHRDLTPGNILCSFQGDVKIADFGLAKAKQRLTKTMTGIIKGQLEYISPEQALGKEIDARADVFSLGVMLFELFAGRRPWTGSNDMELAQQLMTAPPADLFKLRPKIHRELVDIVNKCLEKDPKKRFQTVAEILARFDEWLSSHGYMEDNEEALGRFVRRNAMRQMAWFERATTTNPNDPQGKLLGSLPGPSLPSMKSAPPPAADSSPVTARAAVPSVPKAVPVPARPVMAKVVAPKPADNEPTAAEGKGALAKIPSYAGAPRITEVQEAAEAEGDWGEEFPTLVKGTPEQIAQLRQAQRQGKPFDPKAIAGQANRPQPLDEPTTKDGPAPADVVIRTKKPADEEVLEDPTAPIGDLLRKVREGRTSSSEPPPVPQTTRSAGSGPAPGSELAAEERVRTEAERLSIEAVRLAEEVKAAYARAERKAALAKALSEAATIASDALRLGQTTGYAEAQRKLETALALERTARANDSAASSGTSQPPPSLSPLSMSPLSMSAMAPPPVPPLAPPASAVMQRRASPPASMIPIPSAPPVPSIPSGPRTLPTGTARPEADPLRASDRQALVGSSDDAEATGRDLRPTIGGLPIPAVLVIAVGVVSLILIVLWIGFG
jgi:eukaryotic-like serine/threonine-protein kinase